MSDSKKSPLRISLGGLLIVTAVVALGATVIAKVTPYAERMGEERRYGFLWGLVLVTSLMALPPMFILAVRLGMFGVRGRKLDRDDEIRPPVEARPPQRSIWDDPSE